MMNLAQLLSSRNNGGGGFTDLLGIAREVTPEKIAEVAHWGVDVLRELRNISAALATTGRNPYAVDALAVSELVTIDLFKAVGRPVNTGWIYNSGTTPVQFRYQYSEVEQSGAWVTWLTIPPDYQVSLQTVDIYRLALQPAGSDAGTVQVHLA